MCPKIWQSIQRRGVKFQNLGESLIKFSVFRPQHATPTPAPMKVTFDVEESTLITPCQISSLLVQRIPLSILRSEKPQNRSLGNVIGFLHDANVVAIVSCRRCRGPICVSVPNFVKIGQTLAEIWRFNGFQNGGRPPC